MRANICGIVKKFGKRTVLNGVNISVDEGSCVGLLGINGSGKSTLFNILAGISNCDAGSFIVGDRDLLKSETDDRDLIGYVPQHPPLIEELSCLDNLRLWYSKNDIKREAQDGVIKILGVDKFLKVPVHKMSGGMKKRLSIACAVAKKPKILLMDEPTAALDMICKKAVSDYIEAFKKNSGIVIVSTHDYSELDICDKLYLLKNGTTVEYVFDRNVEKLIGCLGND